MPDDMTPTYDVVVLDHNDDEPVRIIFRDKSYANALRYLANNHERRPNLDMVQGDDFVDWQTTPSLLGKVSDEAAARLRDQR